MKNLILILILGGTVALSQGAETQSSALRLGESPVNAPDVQQQYKTLSGRLIAEYLETGKLSRDSVEAYQLMVGIANRSGVRLEKSPLRTADERNLGPALLIARFEALTLGYDRIYRLKLQNQ